MKEPHSILVVEDDSELRSLVVDLLSRNGWGVRGARDGIEMDAALTDAPADLIVLDINMPGEDGLSIARRVSASTDILILMLTARADDIDRIIGLEVGADDYLPKPFNPRELVARIKALLRRREKSSAAGRTERISVGSITVVPDARRATRGDRELPLTAAEFDLLLVLAEAQGRVLSRDHLLDRVHGRSAHPTDRAIDVLVSRLRKKLDTSDGPSLIEGVRNAGYVLRAE